MGKRKRKEKHKSKRKEGFKLGTERARWPIHSLDSSVPRLAQKGDDGEVRYWYQKVLGSKSKSVGSKQLRNDANHVSRARGPSKVSKESIEIVLCGTIRDDHFKEFHGNQGYFRAKFTQEITKDPISA